jgi:hypothetical protein
MKPIVPPINRSDTDERVLNLQEALLFLLGESTIRIPEDRPQLHAVGLKRERGKRRYGDVTAGVVGLFQLQFQDRFNLHVSEEVDSRTAEALNHLLSELGAFNGTGKVVRGQVRQPGGSPVSSVRVTVFDKDLLVEQRLGETITDVEGRYEVRYTAEQFSRAEKGAADLTFRLFDPRGRALTKISGLDGTGNRLPTLRSKNGNEQPTVVPILFNAAAEATVDLIVADEMVAELSEYESLSEELTPLLAGLSPAHLREDEERQDITFLAGETGQDRQRIFWFAESAKREVESRIIDPAIFMLIASCTLPAPVFYGLFRQNLPTELSALLARGREEWKTALEQSFEQNIIPKRLKPQLDGFLEFLQQLRVEDAFREPAEPGRSSLSMLLRTAGPLTDLQSQRDFLTLYYAHEGPIERFWKKEVPRGLGWDREQIREVQTTLQFVALTSHHLPLIERLQQRDDIKSVRDLTKLERNDWLKLVKAGGRVDVPPDVPGKDDEEKAANYVDGIAGILQATFPTLFAAKIAARTTDSEIRAVQDTLSIFFERATNLPDEAKSFDFRDTSVHDFVTEHGDTVFAGVRSEARTRATVQLKRMGRAFQMSTGPEQMQVLLENKLDSAYHITRVSEDHFVQGNADILGGTDAARRLYAKAEHISATLMNLFVDLNEVTRHTSPRAVGGLTELQKLDLIKKIPSYNELFGALEMCECAHCRSVYSPAAYFVDLLQFLDPDPKSQNPSKPINVLFDRRPDLAHILLSCENTNTPMPYVDLVNEILEFYVAHNKLDKDAAKDTADSTAAELAANPQHTVDDAYKKLKKAIFPLTLPFDRDLEIARAYLKHLGSSRYQVMESFKQTDTPAERRRIEAEYLDISEEEYRILTGENFDSNNPAPAIPLHEYFGFDTETKSTETVWVDDRPLPSGAIARADVDTWDWITADPAPFAGREAHRSVVSVGMHQHYFDSATQRLQIDPDDYLFAHVFLDPANPPEQVMLQWNDGASWEHRVYWGANTKQLNWGENGTESRLPMGLLPSTGRWVKLEVPASYAGLERRQLSGMAFTLVGGRAVWDKAGKRSLSWQDKLTRVPEFLHRARISYVELVELVKTRFINPNHDIFFQAPNSCGDLTLTSIRQGDAGAPDDASLLRMLRFIRLWRKLGWTIEELDKTLLALNAVDTTPDVLLHLAQLKRLRAKLKCELVPLLTLRANIDTLGDDSLYKKLFLSKAALKLDDRFELKADGSELRFADPTRLFLKDHIPAILAAFRISEADLALSRTDAGLEDRLSGPAFFTPLNLANLSTLYRYAVLAKALRLPIKDLISLRTLSGVDPFGALDQALRFAELAGKVRESGFSFAQLNYLYRHISEPSANAPDSDSLVVLARSLRDGLTKITEDNKLAPDPTGELTRTKLGQIFEGAVVSQTMGMLDGTATYTVSPANPFTITFPDSLEPLKRRISYDPTDNVLQFRGAMTARELARLENVSSNRNYRDALKSLFQQPVKFIEDSLSRDKASGFLDPEEAAAKLLGRPRNTQEKLLTLEEKFEYLLENLLPFLRDKLSRILVKQTLSEALQLEAATAAVLLENLSTNGLMDVCLQTRTAGLTGSYFSDPNLGVFANTRIDSAIVFDGKGRTAETTIPAGTQSIRWEGLLLAQNNEKYTFSFLAAGDVRLWVDGQTFPIAKAIPTARELTSKPIPLKAGQLHMIKVELVNMSLPAAAEMRWQSPSTSKTIVPPGQLYPAGVLQAFVDGFTRLHKIALLANTFELTASELVYLDTHKADFANFDLNTLPVERDNSLPSQTDVRAVALFRQWERLFDLVTLRTGLPQRDAGLIDVFGAAANAGEVLKLPSSADNDEKKRRALEQAKKKLLAATRWDEKTADALVGDRAFVLPSIPPALPNGFNLRIDAFKNEIWLVRLQASLKLSRRLGVSVDRLFAWTKEPDPQQAQDIKNTVKAKYEDEQWLTVAKPLNDKLRESQKAALIDYLLTNSNLPVQGVTDSNKLYEYFLIDVDISACMKTSRIKQAISSVQLFVQRCLMNLEPKVSPAQIDAKRWNTWMKRYRVWEANRKVFLYPENWIEPELRDDKSPFFRELESELLQDDVTADNVEKAFLNYLYKLDQVARLEVCGMHWEDVDPETGQPVGILHVLARSPNAPQSFYYRRHLNNATWTSWEKVELDIEGNDLVPIIWNRRLYLMWPMSRKTDKSPNPQFVLAWSQFQQGRWSSKQTAEQSPLSIRQTADAHFQGQTNGDELIIMCTTQLEIGSSNTTLFPFIEVFGGFRFTGCYGEASVQRAQQVSGLIDYSNVISLAFLSNRPSPVMGFYLWPVSALNTPPIGILSKPSGRISYRTAHPGYIVPYEPFFFSLGKRAYFVTTREREITDYYTKSLSPDAIRIEPPLVAQPPINMLADFGDPFSTGVEPSLVGTTRVQPKAAFKIGSVGSNALSTTPWSVDSERFGFRPRTINVRFHTFFHPYVCEFIKNLNRVGISGLLTPENQRWLEELPVPLPDTDDNTLFHRLYAPNGYNFISDTGNVDRPYPREKVDFSNTGAYSLYNWELFFHAPMLLANRLSKNQRFEEAQRWYHYIFNPTSDTKTEPSPQRYWKVMPFKETEVKRIDTLLAVLKTGADSEKQELIVQIEDWRDNPFQPHRIARWRPGAYMKNVAMKYIDNLIAWGDQLFRQDTIESINEATQLYVLAGELLGERPQRLPARGKPISKTYSDLKPDLDAFSNAWVELESLIPFSRVAPAPNGHSTRGTERGLGITTPYFCIPQNDKLLSYWDTVADRLLKIRHCMSIEGIVRELPLFEPPIDPALLVQAAARGIDLNSVLNDINTPTPYYRFSYILQKALELCADLKALGTALLAALEKKDAEELAAIRANHESVILKAVREVKERQRDEATSQVKALKASRTVPASKYAYHQIMLGADNSKIPDIGGTIQLESIPNQPAQNAGGEITLLQHEQSELDSSHSARDWQVIASTMEILASLTHYIPQLTVKGMFAEVTFGGEHIGHALSAIARKQQSKAAQDTYDAAHAGKMSAYFRRQQGWSHESNLAAGEIMHIDKQIAAADIRVNITHRELENHDKQIENSKQIEEFLRNKYTDKELYGWMEGEVLAVYNQCYQMAYDLAKKAEKAFRFERGLTTSSFIEFGYWDSARKGLLAGEKLHLALKQMERAYLDQNKREYEITKHISLLQLDPRALIQLKETGQCEIELPEPLFDLDFPGHYFRRIKSASITIPCVVGPYTGVNCTLTLLRNALRKDSSLLGGSNYERELVNDDPRFIDGIVPIQSIAASNAQNESGMHELNFRDERYLPFEGAGAISRWRIELSGKWIDGDPGQPHQLSQFDFDTISDVILHLRYTAREGGEPLKQAARNELLKSLDDIEKYPQFRLFSVRHEFPTEWHRFFSTAATERQILRINLAAERFPFITHGRESEIQRVDLFLNLPANIGDEVAITPPSTTSATSRPLTRDGAAGLSHAFVDKLDTIVGEPSTWSVSVLSGGSPIRLSRNELQDVVLVCRYSIGEQER